jgi:hypothetical protein
MVVKLIITDSTIVQPYNRILSNGTFLNGLLFPKSKPPPTPFPSASNKPSPPWILGWGDR